MSQFDSQAEVKEVEQDSLGGRKILDQNVYDAVIETAFVKNSQSSNSVALSVTFKIDESTKLTKDYWFIGKDGNNFRTVDGKKHDTFGLLQIKSLSRVATGGEIPESTIAKKTIKLYDFKAKKEEPVEVDMMMGLLGASVKIAISKLRRNRGVKQGDGSYANTGKMIEENDVAKVFHASGHTASEMLEGVDAKFIEDWLGKNIGKITDTFDASKVVEAGSGGNAATNVTPSLFPT